VINAPPSVQTVSYLGSDMSAPGNKAALWVVLAAIGIFALIVVFR
jgi:hypothetical protein